MDNLEARLSRLERENRRYKRFLLALACAVFGAVLMGAGNPVPMSVQARSFEVLNEDGIVTMRLDSDYSGGLLRLFTLKGQEVARVSATPAGGILDLKSPSGLSLVTAQAGFLAGMVRMDAGMLKVSSADHGGTVIMADSVRTLTE